jgi:hypothetical protein
MGLDDFKRKSGGGCTYMESTKYKGEIGDWLIENSDQLWVSTSDIAIDLDLPRAVVGYHLNRMNCVTNWSNSSSVYRNDHHSASEGDIESPPAQA